MVSCSLSFRTITPLIVNTSDHPATSQLFDIYGFLLADDSCHPLTNIQATSALDAEAEGAVQARVKSLDSGESDGWYMLIYRVWVKDECIWLAFHVSLIIIMCFRWNLSGEGLQMFCQPLLYLYKKLQDVGAHVCTCHTIYVANCRTKFNMTIAQCYITHDMWQIICRRICRTRFAGSKMFKISDKISE